MDRVPVVARGSLRHVFASRLALVLGTVGLAVLVAGIIVGPTGAAIGVGVACSILWQRSLLHRRVLAVDVDERGAVLRHGLDGAAIVRIDDVALGIVSRTAGTTYRGIRTGADVEHWLLVGHDGRSVARIDGRGFATDDLSAVRASVGWPWWSASAARRAGLLPADAPWHLRRPRAAVAVALAAGLVTAVVLVTALVLLTRLGAVAFVWPWW